MKRLDYTAAAAFIGVKPGTLRSMVSRRQVPHIRLSKRVVVFEESALQTWLDAHRVEVTP